MRLLISSLIVISLFLAGCTAEKVENEETKEGQTNVEEQTEMGESEKTNDENHDIEKDTSHAKIDILSDDSITVLVNKHNSLSTTFIPDDLVDLSVRTVLENPEINQLRAEAAEALKEMFKEAEKNGVYLYARSGFRSYETQSMLFQNYENKHGIEAALRFSAEPGYSEHQTGLVIDVTAESVDLQLSEQFGKTEEGKWLNDNAHRFGFIIRYPKDKEAITGYIYEPWHLRYLGISLATSVYESGLTYEEFLVEVGKIDAIDSKKR